MSEEKPSFGSLSVKGGVVVLPIAVCFFTLLGFLGSFFWIFDLFTHFRAQYLLVLILCSIYSFMTRNSKFAAVFCVFALINLAMVAPLFWGHEFELMPNSSRLKLMTLNVNSSGGDIEKVEKVIRESQADLVALQEISSRWLELLEQQKSEYPYSIICPRDDNFGIALLSRFQLSASQSLVIGKAGVPSIVTRVLCGSATVQVIVTHPLPPVGKAYTKLRDDQLEQIPRFMSSEVPVILVGDLNTSPWSYAFKRLLSAGALLNSAAGFGLQATWPANNPVLRIPIDHVLLTSKFKVIDRRIGENVGSDHLPVLVELVLPD